MPQRRSSAQNQGKSVDAVADEASEEVALASSKELAAPNESPAKRQSKRADTESVRVSKQNAVKRSRAPDAADSSVTIAQKASTKRKKKDTPHSEAANSTLPIRSKRVQNPGLPDAARHKRSSAQVAADNRQLEALRAEEEEFRIRREKILAQMEVEQEIEERAEAAFAVTNLRDIERFAVSGAMDEEDEIMKSLDAIGRMQFVDDNSEGEAINQVQYERPRRFPNLKKLTKAGEDQPQDGPAASNRGKKKVVRGEVRAGVEVEKERLRTELAAGLGASIRKPTLSFPAGIYPGWKADSVPSRPEARLAASKIPRDAGRVLGGLDSGEDIAGERPTNPIKKSVHYRNDVLVFEDSPEDLVQVKSRKAAPARLPAKAKDELHDRLNPLGKTDPIPTANPTPATVSNTEIDIMPSIVRISASSSRTSAKVSIRELPSTLESTWLSKLLPAIYYGFFISNEPFEDFVKGQKLVDFLQLVVDKVHPELGVMIEEDDVLYTTAYRRIGEKRSLFGSKALQIVGTFLETLSPAQRTKYIAWALEDTGPALWKEPVPHGEKGEPSGFFESKFIEGTFTEVVKSVKTSTITFGFPKGALALAGAAVERAFNIYSEEDAAARTSTFMDDDVPHTKKKSMRPEFSKDNYGDHVADYMVNINKFSPSRIEYFAGLVNLRAPKEAKPQAPLARRRNLLYQGSPVKGSEI